MTRSILFLDIESIEITPGFLWTSCSIHLQDTQQDIHLGGFGKSAATELKEYFNHQQSVYFGELAKKLSPTVNEAFNRSSLFLKESRYIRHETPQQWLKMYVRPLSIFITRAQLVAQLTSTGQTQIKKLQPFLVNKHKYIEAFNHAYIERQLDTYQDFFDTVEDNPLTQNQRLSCVIDERFNLVLAGAGTGKTSTIVARAGYLVKAGQASPKDILLLAFGNEAAKEMDERIREKLGFNNLTAKTFHSFGQHIISQVENKKPSISVMATDTKAFTGFIDDNLKKLITIDEYQSSALNYLLYEKYPYKNPFSFKTKKAYEQYILDTELRTFNKDLVKSYEELLIANFLFQQGINYQYEANYEVDTGTPDHRDYQPDFYLPDHGLYIEHFGIDENNKTAPFVPRKKYLEGMEWKRNLHQKHKTRLVETYSYEQSQGVLLESLASKLKEQGVEFRPVANYLVLKQLEALGEVLKLSELLADLVSQFKISMASFNEFSQTAEKASYKAILKIFKPIYDLYESQLKKSNTIDFNDMIIKATAYVISGEYKSPYKYIMVDEFQDISAPRNALIKALLAQNSLNGFYCVGDDWQSIYRFTGSDINIINNFETHYGYTVTTILDKTFRFNNKIGHVASRFIQCNSKQFKKDIKSHKNIENTAVSLLKTVNINNGVHTALTAISSKSTKPASVLILSRFHFRFKDLNLNSLKNSYPHLKISTQSIHASKGKEADYVIVIGLEKGRLGLPSTQASHPLLTLLLPNLEAFPYAEERRVFYVALTRAKNHVYLITDPNKPSPFVRELLNDKYDINNGEFSNNSNSKLVEKNCEHCEVGYMVPRTGKYGKFLGCDNPTCHHTEAGCDRCNSALIAKGEFRLCENTDCDFKEPICAECGSGMKLRKSRYGKFWGCNNYKSGNEFSCGHTEKFIQF